MPTIPTSSQPITALLIGSDHRGDGATGKNGLSDTLMLARLDPSPPHGLAALDPARPVGAEPGGAKINSAYSEGGDARSLETVEAVTGVKPNYLLNVDFTGFQRLVDTLGGIYVNVDQYYYNPPAQSQYTGFSAIDVKPGYQRLNGADALAFSRYRHTDDDFHRQARQQTFLRAFEARASARIHGISVTDIPFINNLLGALSSSVTIVGPGGHAPSPRTLLSFAATAYNARSHIVSVHLGWTPYTAPDGEAALNVTNLSQAIFQWKHPWLLSNAAATLPGKAQHKKPVWKPAVTPAGVKVAVLNGNGRERRRRPDGAGPQGLGLPGEGRERSRLGVHARPGPTTAPGAAAAAADLAHIVGNASAAAMPAAIAAATGPRVQVALVIGPGFTGKLAVAAPKKQPKRPTGPPATITPTTSYRADFVHAQQALHFPVMYPTVAQADSTLCPWVPVPAGAGVLSCQGTSTSPTRVYAIPAAGHGLNSTYAVFHMSSPSGDAYWGIEETRYTAAPLLETPNATRHLDGRDYLFFFNGSHIQTIAFVQGGIAYWVQNTLLDDLTDPEMLAIARSLRPVRSH